MHYSQQERLCDSVGNGLQTLPPFQNSKDSWKALVYHLTILLHDCRDQCPSWLDVLTFWGRPATAFNHLHSGNVGTYRRIKNFLQPCLFFQLFNFAMLLKSQQLGSVCRLATYGGHHDCRKTHDKVCCHGMPRGCQHLYIFQKKCEAQGYAQLKSLKRQSCAFLAWAPLMLWRGQSAAQAQQ